MRNSASMAALTCAILFSIASAACTKEKSEGSTEKDVADQKTVSTQTPKPSPVAAPSPNVATDPVPAVKPAPAKPAAEPDQAKPDPTPKSAPKKYKRARTDTRAKPVEPVASAKPSALPERGKKCAAGKCASGLECITYYGIAGPRGPAFTSCEQRCGKGRKRCPKPTSCTVIADGPGQVCR